MNLFPNNIARRWYELKTTSLKGQAKGLAADSSKVLDQASCYNFQTVPF